MTGSTAVSAGSRMAMDGPTQPGVRMTTSSPRPCPDCSADVPDGNPLCPRCARFVPGGDPGVRESPAVSIKWKRPRAAADREWRAVAPGYRRMAGYFLKWGVLIGVPAVYAIYRTMPDAALRVGLRFASGLLLFPLVLHAEGWLIHKCVSEYEINDRGMTVRGIPSAFHPWTRIKECRIQAASALPGLRALEFKIRGKGWEREQVWYFNPRDVDEGELARMIEAGRA